MKTLLAVSAVTLTSAMYALPASAGCTDPRSPHAFSAMPHLLAQAATMGDQEAGHSHRSIVGTWHVTYTTGGAPGGEAFIQWHSDGTEVINSGGHSPASANWCMGVWAQTGFLTYEFNHFPIAYNPTTGEIANYINIRGQIMLSPGGDSYTGTFTLDVYDPKGNHVDHLAGAVVATRLTVDSTLPTSIPNNP